MGWMKIKQEEKKVEKEKRIKFSLSSVWNFSRNTGSTTFLERVWGFKNTAHINTQYVWLKSLGYTTTTKFANSYL